MALSTKRNKEMCIASAPGLRFGCDKNVTCHRRVSKKSPRQPVHSIGFPRVATLSPNQCRGLILAIYF